MKKQKNLLFIICLLVLIAAVAFGAGYQINLKRKKDVYENMAQEAVAEPEPEEEQEETPEPEPELPDIPVDFSKLQEQNPDIYAWIHIEDTVVDYPILQSIGNDDYYLTHTVDNEAGRPGAIYTQYSYNNYDMTDNVTVIYGHNMRNDSMFGSLSEYLDEEFRDSHSEIQIYTPKHILTYRVVFTITYDNRHILSSFDCSTPEGYDSLLNSLQTERLMPSWIDDSYNITTDDRLVILSTCNNNSDQRFLVGAVLVNEE